MIHVSTHDGYIILGGDGNGRGERALASTRGCYHDDYDIRRSEPRAPPCPRAAASAPLPVRHCPFAVPRAAATDESRALQLLSGVIERVGQDRGPTRRAKYKSREPSFFGARPRASKLLSFSLPIAACCAFVIATFMMKWPIAARVVVRHVENN